MKTFNVQTLGCKVNIYESQQLAALLRQRGLTETDASQADLRIINSCCVTSQAASQSRQTVRRTVAQPPSAGNPGSPSDPTPCTRTIVTGCWATSDSHEAASIPGVDAVITHHQDVAAELDRLLSVWKSQEPQIDRALTPIADKKSVVGKDACGWSNNSEASSASPAVHSKSSQPRFVNENTAIGTRRLPLLGQHQVGRQRAVMKIQDGCDASCTYCIIPRLRPALWSKSIDDAIAEAGALVAAGHVEIVLTGIFLGAYGHPTALRRRQPASGSLPPLAQLIEALCTKVSGLGRLRLSSLEPGDMTDALISVLRAHQQIIPHFHLPLQSGSDTMLRRMNRQYRTDDYRRMIDRVRGAFDRPALTTDVIVGFPGEGETEFAQTQQMVRHAGFIHVHAFPYSPRPGTAAARWEDQFIPRKIANQRIAILSELARKQSLAFRRQFIGSTVEVIVEGNRDSESTRRRGRCERYFQVEFESDTARPGDAVRVTILGIDDARTLGQPVRTNLPPPHPTAPE